MTITGQALRSTKDEIDRMMKDAEAHAEEDRDRREEAEVRNNADSLVFQTEKLLRDQADKVEADDREKMEAALKELKDALAGTDIDAVKHGHENLVTVSQDFAQRLYARRASGAERGGGAGRRWCRCRGRCVRARRRRGRRRRDRRRAGRAERMNVRRRRVSAGDSGSADGRRGGGARRGRGRGPRRGRPRPAAGRASASWSTRSGACRPTSRTTASARNASSPCRSSAPPSGWSRTLLPVLDSFDGALGSFGAGDVRSRRRCATASWVSARNWSTVLERAGLERMDADGAAVRPERARSRDARRRRR